MKRINLRFWITRRYQSENGRTSLVDLVVFPSRLVPNITLAALHRVYIQGGSPL